MTIRTFTANPAVDETVVVDALRLGEPLRPRQRLRVAGGKGINVARTVVHLGGEVRAHGVVSGPTGWWLGERLDEEGIDEDLVFDRDGDWSTRETLVITDERDSLLLYDAGDPIPGPRLRESAERCASDLPAGSVLVVSGSLPRGDHTDTLRWLLSEARRRGANVVVDTSGPALRVARAVGAAVVKVERAEAAEVTGTSDAQLAARSLLDGFERAVVTTGADGAVAAARGEETLRVRPPRVDARYTAGSGDAFAGALAMAIAAATPWPEALRRAAAAGAANTLQPGAGALDAADLERLLPETVVEPA